MATRLALYKIPLTYSEHHLAHLWNLLCYLFGLLHYLFGLLLYLFIH